MPRLTLDLSMEEIKALIFQLPPEEFLTLVDAIGERAETIAMIQLAETGFREWNEAGEDIYGAEAQTRGGVAPDLMAQVQEVLKKALFVS